MNATTKIWYFPIVFFNVRSHWDLPGMLCDAFHESIFIPLFMCKRIYLSGLCSYIVELHIPGFFLPAGKIAFEKDLHSIQMNFVTYSFRISIDSIIFPWFFFFLFLCNFLHRFFMIKFKQKLRKQKKRSTLRIICDYIFGKQLWSNPHSKWFYSCSRVKDNPLFVRV